MERYTKICDLTQNLNFEDCPVVISAGALLNDTKKGIVLTQLKFTSASDKKIIAISVSVKAFDACGKELKGVKDYKYLDLNVGCDESFGSEKGIPMPDSTTRDVKVLCTSITYDDNSTWKFQQYDKWSIYTSALNIMSNATTENDFLLAAEGFKKISGYKDADVLVAQCLDKAEICRKDAIYNTAKSKITGNKTSSYEEAITIFQSVSGWKDADEQIIVCQRKIEEIKAKEEEKFIAEEKAKKKLKKILFIATPILIACIAFVIILNNVIIPKQKYNKAMVMINSGDYVSAYTLLDGISYKDSEDKLQSIRFKYEQILLEKANVGGAVSFGSYEQDNDSTNGKEDIEWLVLAKEDNKILVISDKALDCQRYNTSWENITWEDCSLRKWLNSGFLSSAFSEEEQAMIGNTNVSADKNPEYDTDPGNDTTDKAFLLSIEEAEKYLTSDEDRMCVPTEYAIAQGASTSSNYTKGGEATCWWWLRSPGSSQNSAAGGDGDGSVGYYGNYVHGDGGCIRPALWINLES